MQTTKWFSRLECCRNVKLTDLSNKSPKIPRIDVKNHSGNVSGNFVGATQKHTPHDPGSLPSPSKSDVNYRGH